MDHALSIMRESASSPIQEPKKSIGGLIGGEARLADLHRARGAAICGSVLSRAITYSMAVLETNTSMGLIVAAPTAGSSGIVPGLLLALQEEYSIPDSRVIDALFNAGAIGYLAMRNATVQARWAAARQRWGLPRLWPPRLPWSSWEELQNSVSMPPRRFS